MARGSDPAKVARWTACLARFRDSGLTVARFCDKEGVSAPSFYQWRRKLAEMDELRRESGATQSLALGESGNGSAFQSVEVLASASAATIRLPNGVEIDLGSDLRAFDLLASRLLDGSSNGKDGCRC